MALLNRNQMMFGTLALATAGVLAWGGSVVYDRFRDRVIVIAAGDQRSESYILAEAIRTVTERRHPYLTVRVQETSGTTQSLAFLNEGKAQFAIAQADVIAGAHARGEARLFEELFQIVVREDSPIKTVDDLKGKTIAVARKGEQFQEFLSLTRRRGLKESDFQFIGDDSDSASAAFARGQADVFFAVRPVHTSSVARITQNIAVRFIPIESAEAMRLEVPAYRAGVVLRSSYHSDPPIPDTDVKTVALDRLLLAHEDVPEYISFTIAQVLSENRQEIAQAIPDADDQIRQLTGGIRPPENNTGLAAAVHPGAEAYYSNRKLAVSPGELVIAVAFTGTLAWLWLAAFRDLRHQQQKRYSDAFNAQMMKLVEEAHTGSARTPEEIRNDSLRLLSQVVADLDAEKISPQQFTSSRGVWQIAYDLMRDGTAGASMLGGAQSSPAKAPAPPKPPAVAPEKSLRPEFRTNVADDEEGESDQSGKRPWSMWRDS